MRWEFRIRMKRGRQTHEYLVPVDAHSREDAISRLNAAITILCSKFKITDLAMRKAGTFDYLTLPVGDPVKFAEAILS